VPKGSPEARGAAIPEKCYVAVRHHGSLWLRLVKLFMSKFGNGRIFDNEQVHGPSGHIGR
jgi:hypothetical protein